MTAAEARVAAARAGDYSIAPAPASLPGSAAAQLLVRYRVRRTWVEERVDNLPAQALIAVLRLVSNGNSNKEVGRQLAIKEETVKAHVSTVLAKLGAKDRTHAVTIATRRGILVD